jgi:hypothetical protein
MCRTLILSGIHWTKTQGPGSQVNWNSSKYCATCCHLEQSVWSVMLDARYYKVAVYCSMLSSQLRELLDTLKAECILTLRPFSCEKKELPFSPNMFIQFSYVHRIHYRNTCFCLRGLHLQRRAARDYVPQVKGCWNFIDSLRFIKRVSPEGLL